MSRQNSIASGVIIMIVISLYFYFGEDPAKNRKVVKVQKQTDPKTDNRTENLNQRGITRIPARSLPSITANELKTLRNIIPTQEEIRTEVKKDTHRTPDSLIKFATTMGPLMEKAYKNDDDAELLIKELQGCALDQTAALSARGLCMTNVDKLAKTHPQMKENASELRANVSPDVLNLLEKKNLLKK